MADSMAACPVGSGYAYLTLQGDWAVPVCSAQDPHVKGLWHRWPGGSTFGTGTWEELQAQLDAGDLVGAAPVALVMTRLDAFEKEPPAYQGVPEQTVRLGYEYLLPNGSWATPTVSARYGRTVFYRAPAGYLPGLGTWPSLQVLLDVGQVRKVRARASGRPRGPSWAP